ncbi:hypothetical protein [Sutcliffiella halmapala]|uniref:hypothetical protein n=1 Tax=Sutcliffiella halmapala TaxID=79882 RepID=UPI000994DBC0|nr:hypothetical protein [Sutcliffiella halmapala]
MIFLLSILGIIILVGGLVTTIAIAGKGDENYQSATKGNVTRLTSIYVILLVMIVLGFILYLN